MMFHNINLVQKDIYVPGVFYDKKNMINSCFKLIFQNKKNQIHAVKPLGGFFLPVLKLSGIPRAYFRLC